MHETVDVSVPIGISGTFLNDRMRFSRLSELFSEFSSSSEKLRSIEIDLQHCNAPDWLVSFERRCQRLKRSAKQELISHVAKLEPNKTALQSRLADIRRELLELEPTALSTFNTLAGLPTNLSLKPTQRRMPDVAARNVVIDAHVDESDLAICQILDAEFPSLQGRPATGIPDSWFAEFEVLTYRQAYERYPQLVHTLISKRRRLVHSPSG